MSRREIILRNALSTLLLEQGYNIFLPAFDEGIDLIAHREAPWDLKLIQQKSRWSILRKYVGRSIWIAFPHEDIWYLVPHDDMVNWKEVQPYLASASGRESGIYHVGAPSRALMKRCAEFALS